MSRPPLHGKRIVVTGGAGFLGSHVVEALLRHGANAKNLITPRRPNYDLVDRAACRKLLADAKPDLVSHLAAKVGGIGANASPPGLFLYENAMTGRHHD